MALFAALAGANELGKQVGFDVGSLTKPIGNLFSFGSSCSDSQNQQKAEIAQEIRQYLTPADMRDLVRNTESRVKPNPDDMADFFLGGRDCKHKNVSRNDQRFLDRLPGLIRQRKRESQSAANQFNAAVQGVKNQGAGVVANVSRSNLVIGAAAVVAFLFFMFGRG